MRMIAVGRPKDQNNAATPRLKAKRSNQPKNGILATKLLNNAAKNAKVITAR